MKQRLLNAGVALAGLLADPTTADAQHFTPEQLKAAAERSDKVNDQLKAQEEDGGAGGTDLKGIVDGLGCALLGVAVVAGAYGASKVIYKGVAKVLDKPDDGSAPAEQVAPAAQGPTQLGPTQLGPTQLGPTQLEPTQLGPTPTDGQHTSPAEAAESINTGLDLDSSSLNPGLLLNYTEFRDADGVEEQDGIGWDLSRVEELATRTGKKTYRIDLTPSENEHFDRLVISISQSEASEDDDDYLLKAAFLKTNPDGTISAPYLVSLNRLNPGAKLDRDALVIMVEEAMAQISNHS
jgi:hypothetical protein